MNLENAVAEQKQSQPTVNDFVNSLIPQIQRALPAGLDPIRIARLAQTEIRKEPKLKLCTAESLAGSLLTASALGLEPGINGEAYLIAYQNKAQNIYECQWQMGYQGMLKLFWQHPLAAGFDAKAVYEKDEFHYEFGLNPVLKHVPAKGERGKLIYTYAVAHIRGQESRFEVLSIEEINRIRQKSNRNSVPDPQNWMERKTAIRQLFKTIPKSVQMINALATEEKSGRELHAELVAAKEDQKSIEAKQMQPLTVNTKTGEVIKQ